MQLDIENLYKEAIDHACKLLKDRYKDDQHMMINEGNFIAEKYIYKKLLNENMEVLEIMKIRRNFYNSEALKKFHNGRRDKNTKSNKADS